MEDQQPDIDLEKVDNDPFASLGPQAKGPVPAIPRAPSPTTLTIHPKAWYEQPLPEDAPSLSDTAVAKPGKIITPPHFPDASDAQSAAETVAGGVTGVDMDELKSAVRGELTSPEVEHLYATGIIPAMLGMGPEKAGAKAIERGAEALAPMAKGAMEALPGAARDAISGVAHPAWIDQRLPKSVVTPAPKGKVDLESTFGGPRLVDLDAMKASPAQYEKNVGLVRDYPNMRPTAGAPTDQVADSFIDHVKDNLLWLYDQIPPEIRNRSSKWYEGGNKIVKDWAQQYGLPEASVAGVIARLSPQNDWFNNVTLAKRVLENYLNNKSSMTPEMVRAFRGSELNKPKYQGVFNAIRDKSLADIDKFDVPEGEKRIYKAMWIRFYDEAHGDPSYPMISPEGESGPNVRIKDGSRETPRAWQASLPGISSALGAIDARGDQAKLNVLMGGKHKVRNFYNNLLDPWSSRGDVTIDTHAVAGGLLRPFGGNSLEVSHNFDSYAGKGEPGSGGSDITGVRGTYPLYAEAYRKAAQERGILPRQLQSVTWEAARGLFPEDWKSVNNSAIIDNIWRQYRSGRVGIDETRQRILDAAGGIEPPSWLGVRFGGGDEAARGAANAPRLSDSGALGQAAEAGRGTGVVPAGSVSEEGLTWKNPLEAWKNYDWEREPETGRAVRAGSLGEGVGAKRKALTDDDRRAAKAEAAAASERAAEGRPRLIDLPTEHVTKAGYYVPGPMGKLHDLAEEYTAKVGLPYEPPKTYAGVDEDRAKNIAKAFDEMKHDPSDPRVRASYDAMIKETLAQYQVLKNAGIKFEFIRPDMENPYKLTPRLAAKDVLDNHHLWVYPTSSGFGSDAAMAEAIKDNPLLQPVDEYIDGKQLAANDVFRIVHDMFGHFKDGNGFRARGEENAWRSHSAMYSDLARPAMTTETRGQNSWLNYGPHGAKNRTATQDDTIYADQKIGLLPDWAIEQGRRDVPGRADGGDIALQPVDHNPFAGGGRANMFQMSDPMNATGVPPISVDPSRFQTRQPEPKIRGEAWDRKFGSYNQHNLDVSVPLSDSTEAFGKASTVDLPPEAGVGTRDNILNNSEIGLGVRGQFAHGGRVEPKNIDPNPTEAQKKAGNYAKDKINWFGRTITIENAKGSKRRGVSKGGHKWESVLPAHYGYFNKTEGADGDHVDVYVGPHIKSERAYVIDQVDASTKEFDEHKSLVGFSNKRHAVNTYKKAFSDDAGGDRVGRVHVMTVDQLNEWLDSGDTKKEMEGKETKDEVRYRTGTTARHCSICTMWVPQNSCTAVEGRIAGGAICDLFKPK